MIFRRRMPVDRLTGLPAPNGHAAARLDALWSIRARSQTERSVLLLDLEGFGLVNCEFGFSCGDDVLRGVAHRVVVESGERPVWRVGGDEFLVVDPGGRREAVALAEQILKAIRFPILIPGGLTATVDARIGIAVGRERDAATDLLFQADRAMYSTLAGRRDQRIGIAVGDWTTEIVDEPAEAPA